MKIGRITLHNFKCFEGLSTLDGLAEGLTSKKRIVLLGGLNGAGKTTLFESILLCLYGKRNKTLWPSKGTKREDYQNYIVAVTNNSAKRKELRPELWIEVSLEDLELGGIEQFLTVKRYWKIDTQTNTILSEELTISGADGNPFDYVSENDWEEFVTELIPYEISQFFFFDGEKIQDFVKDEDKEFAESLEKILGISLYDQLSTDLEEVRRRIVRKHNQDQDAKIQLATIEAEIAECEKAIYRAEEQVANLEDEIREHEERSEQIDKETRRITQVKAQTLEEYEQKKTDLLAGKRLCEERIFEAIQHDLPFLLVAPLCQELVTQLKGEQQLHGVQAAQKAIEPKITQIVESLFQGDGPKPPLTSDQEDFYKEKLRKTLHEVLAEKPEDLDTLVPLHGLARTDIDQIQIRIEGTYQTMGQLDTYVQQLQDIEPELKKISQTEQKAVDTEAARLYEEKGRLAEAMAAHTTEIENLQLEMDIQKGGAASKKKQRREYEDRVEKTLKMKDQIEYTKRLRTVLRDFSHRLRAQKVHQLQEYTVSMWSRLAHKKDQIKSIIINPDRQFSIELYDSESKLIDKTKLSAGEKELLAISLIWALSRLANRSLPVVIDTPLGRLDTIHRARIAKNYFSNASHQVILLSTDSEIVDKEYGAIESAISKSFTLRKEKATETTLVTNGYFE